MEAAPPVAAHGGCVLAVDRAEIRLVPRRWDYAERLRAEIDAYFRALRLRNPALWNGRTLLTHGAAAENRVLTGTCFETDYASFLHWRDHGFPDGDVKNAFSMAALRARDGAFVLGTMGQHTANSGQSYFVAGMLEPADLAGGVVDFEASVRRELAEETGLTFADVEVEPGWFAVFAAGRLALAKLLHAREDGESVRARIRRHIAADAEPELADVRLVHGPQDLDALIPDHVLAFLDHVWGR